MKNSVNDTLFYSGGTLNKDQIINTTHKLYNVAFNDNHMFIFNKDNRLLKVVKYTLQTEYTYKVLKTFVKISESFKEMLTDDFWYCPIRGMLDGVMKITRSV